MAISGILSAEFEGDATTPEGVRVQLAPGADPDMVGREVRRVLAGHGMRSQMTAPAIAPRSAPPPPEPRTVINLAEFGPDARDRRNDPASASDEAVPPAPDAPESRSTDRVEPAVAAGEPADPEPVGEDAGALREQTPTAESVPILGDVTVTQRGSGVVVSVAAGDRVTMRPAVASEGGIDAALLAAVCELLDVAPLPSVVAVSTAEVGSTEVVSVLIDDGTGRRAGSAVNQGNRSWAVARAFWSAVSGPV